MHKKLNKAIKITNLGLHTKIWIIMLLRILTKQLKQLQTKAFSLYRFPNNIPDKKKKKYHSLH